MPAYDNPGGGQDMFGDGDASAAPKETESTSGEQTGILPKSILGGKDFKPGEEIVLKIVAIHDNDVEVEYAQGEKEPEKEEAGPEETMAQTPEASNQAPSADMASMME